MLPGAGDCFFLPQKPFMPLGSLRQQLCFPSGVGWCGRNARGGCLIVYEGRCEEGVGGVGGGKNTHCTSSCESPQV